MKIKKRLIISFFAMIFFPTFLIIMAISGILSYQTSVIEEDYGIEEGGLSLFVSPLQVLNRMTSAEYIEIKKNVLMDAQKMEDLEYIDSLNQKITEKYSFLILKKGKEYVYVGNEEGFQAVKNKLPEFGDYQGNDDGGFFTGSSQPYLIKRQDFYFPDASEGSIYLVTEINNLVPQLRSALFQLLLAFILILFLTALLLIFWIYRGIVRPINLLRKATNRMMEGDLEYSLVPELQEELIRQRPFCAAAKRIRKEKKSGKTGSSLKANDEIGILCEDFEKMRIRMKETMQKRVQFEEDQRELISNISHDLKTPLTAIKGYTEGIMDGVAETPEKRERYLRTIYKKANDMISLVDELSFYSKIDCNTIPYEFAVVDAKEYFKDCVNDVGLDLEVKGINLAYFYYLEDGVKIVADAEKLKRVINNVIGNSVKYMDKKKGSINIRMRDIGDFIQIEVEDNGKGIPEKDVPYIFERFYRSDTSRNSRKGGSGLGLSISRKIIEDHGGKIWAASRENVGTSIFFTLCKEKPNMVMAPSDEAGDGKEEKKGWKRRFL